MNLRAIRVEVHNLILNARRLERIINSPEFEALFLTLPPEEQSLVTLRIQNQEIEMLVAWLHAKLRSEVGDTSLRELRITAGQLGITRYSLMSKEQLIKAILNEQSRRREHSRQLREVESLSSIVPEKDTERHEGRNSLPTILGMV